MSWYAGEGSPKKYDEHFDKWTSKMRRQATSPWPYKILMAKKTKGLVLDAGCGPGYVSRYIKNGVFLDFSRVALKKRWIGGSRPRVLASVEDLPFRNNVFDSVLASELIEHTDKPQSFVAESHRVLREGGLFTLSFPWSDPSSTHHFKRVTREMIKRWLNNYFNVYEFAEPPVKKGRAVVYAYKQDMGSSNGSYLEGK